MSNLQLHLLVLMVVERRETWLGHSRRQTDGDLRSVFTRKAGGIMGMGGAGMPCACVRADGLEELDVRLVLENDSQHEINVTPSSQSNTGGIARH